MKIDAFVGSDDTEKLEVADGQGSLPTRNVDATPESCAIHVRQPLVVTGTGYRTQPVEIEQLTREQLQAVLKGLMERGVIPEEQVAWEVQSVVSEAQRQIQLVEAAKVEVLQNRVSALNTSKDFYKLFPFFQRRKVRWLMDVAIEDDGAVAVEMLGKVGDARGEAIINNLQSVFSNEAFLLVAKLLIKRNVRLSGGDVIASIMGDANLRNLTSLWFDNYCLDVRGAELLAACDLPRLRVLGLHLGRIESVGMAALVDSEILDRLVVLNVTSNDLGDVGVQEIACRGRLRNVKKLFLGGNGIGVAGIEALANSENGLKLESLWLNRNYQVGIAGMQALASSMFLPRLKNLYLTECGVGGQGVVALMGSKSICAIVELDVSSNGIGDEGAVAIACSSNSESLAELDIRNNEIGDEGAIALSESPFLQRLKNLWIGKNRNIKGAGVIALKRRFGSKLKDIDWLYR